MVRIAELSRRISNNIVVSEATAQVNLHLCVQQRAWPRSPRKCFLLVFVTGCSVLYMYSSDIYSMCTAEGRGQGAHGSVSYMYL